MKIDKAVLFRPGQFVLRSAHVDASSRFYETLFGWGHGGDGVFDLEGEPVARAEYGDSGWLPYLTVDNLRATVDHALDLGATLQGETVTTPAGRTAVIVDPTGAPVGLWERDSGAGIAVMAEPGSVVWIEEKTFGQAKAVTFLQDLFGFEAVGPSGPGKVRVLRAEGPPFGGVMQFDDRWAPDEKPHWLVYFQVLDAAIAVERAVALGATVWFPVFDTPLGELAYLRDPEGNAFAVVAVSSQGGAITEGAPA